MNLLTKGLLAVAATTLTATTLTACGTDEGYNAFCTQKRGTDYIRVDDRNCDNNLAGYGYYYFPYGGSYPAIGGKASGGSTKVPSSGNVTKGKLPTTAGKATAAPKGAPKVSTKKNDTGGSKSGGGSKGGGSKSGGGGSKGGSGGGGYKGGGGGSVSRGT